MKKCKVVGCSNKLFSKAYCIKHYKQIYRYGKIKRTIYDLNEIIKSKYYIGIFLYNKKCQRICYTIIDKEYYNTVKNYKWSLCNGYAVNHVHKIKLHQLIMKGKNIDHKNSKTLDNRKSNLRKCTHSENLMNRGKQKNNKSGYKGVSWDKDKNKWKSSIMLNRKTINLGRFDSLKLAAKAYNKGALKYHGEFARLNQV